jgi:hypothetical protein
MASWLARRLLSPSDGIFQEGELDAGAQLSVCQNFNGPESEWRVIAVSSQFGQYVEEAKNLTFATDAVI